SVRSMPRKNCNQLMISDLQVAHVHPMHSTAQQSAEFTIGIEVVGNFLTIDLQVHRVELEVFPDVHRDKERHLRVRREKQLFLQQEQVAIQGKHFFLQRLHVLVETPELPGVTGCFHRTRTGRRRAHLLGERSRMAKREPRADYCNSEAPFYRHISSPAPFPHQAKAQAVNDYSRSRARICVRYFSS